MNMYLKIAIKPLSQTILAYDKLYAQITDLKM